MQHKDRKALPMCAGEGFCFAKAGKTVNAGYFTVEYFNEPLYKFVSHICDFHLKNRHQGQPKYNQPLCSIQQGQLERTLQCRDKQDARHQKGGHHERKDQPGIDSLCPHPDGLRIGALIKSAKHLREGQHTERHCLTGYMAAHACADPVSASGHGRYKDTLRNNPAYQIFFKQSARFYWLMLHNVLAGRINTQCQGQAR